MEVSSWGRGGAEGGGAEGGEQNASKPTEEKSDLK